LLTWVLSHLLLLLGFLLAVPTIAVILRQRRSPAASLAWLMAIVLVPYLGIPLFITLGGRKMRRLVESKEPIELPEQQLLPQLEEHRELDRLLRSYGLKGACSGNRIKLLQTGEAGYAALTAMIETARESIWVSTFILHPDSVGKAIIEQLARRAAAGIEVRVLLDGVGSMQTGKRYLSPLLDNGGQVAFFMPVIHHPLRGRSNLRNHRKTVIVDSRKVWAGGANIAEEYIGPTPNPQRWKDLTFTLEGPAIFRYIAILESDWKFATGRALTSKAAGIAALEDAGQVTVQIVPSGPDVDGDPLYATLVAAVFHAKKLIRIVTPYFIPDETLSQSLQLAAHRGVKVQVLVPERSNHRLADRARTQYLRDLQHAGGEVLLYRGGMVHGKALLADDQLAVIGSANFDMRSLFLNYETGLLLYAPDEIYQLHAWFAEMASNCQCGLPPAGLLRDLEEGIARMLAPIL